MTIYDIIAWTLVVLVSVGGLVYIYKHPEQWIVSTEDKDGNQVYFCPYM